jgi:phosphate transport system substrate-binding protein
LTIACAPLVARGFVCLGLMLLSQRSVAQQQAAIFCLASGAKIAANRFEARDGKFFLYVAGSTTPAEYPASAIKGINVDPCPGATATDASIGASSKSTMLPTASDATSIGRFGVHGSNTIGERLMPMLIEAYANQKLGAAPIVKLTANEEQDITLKSPEGTLETIELHAHGSGTAAKSLIEGKALIGMASRSLTPEEVKLIQDKFKIDARASGNEHVLALDGLAVIVNPANPVQEMSLELIARIFSGEISNWKDLGGPDRAIKLVRRDDKSGTFDTFKNLVLAPYKLEMSRQSQRFESSEALSELVSKDPDAIGFVGLPYINKNIAVTIASNCGISSRPSKFAVKIEEYPLTRRLYLYTAGPLADRTARDLLQFTLSDDAQPTIEEAEFVEQAIVFQDDAEHRQWIEDHVADSAAKQAPREAPAQFKRLASMTKRSSLAFRFREGSATLDNRAMQDAARLARFLKATKIPGRRLFIVGFADAVGGWQSNQKLARERAEQVSKALAQNGLALPKDSIKSFSYLAPGACNEDKAGAAKNRRVEVWVAP